MTSPAYATMVALLQVDGEPINANNCFSTSLASLFLKYSLQWAVQFYLKMGSTWCSILYFVI